MPSGLRERVKKELKLVDEAERDERALKILHNEVSGYIEGAEQTHLLTQEEIKRHVCMLTKEKAFDIYMKNGPFFVSYTKNGRHMLVRNSKGFLSSFDVKSLKVHFEIDVKDEIQDALYLHNECFLATAQKESVFIYDNQGVEIHCIREHRHVIKMEYLFYHFLLCTLSTDNFLKYQDVSTGKMISEIYVKERNKVMRQNRETAVLYLGSDKGTVTLWSPNCKEYLAKVLCHTSPITNIEIDRSGTYLISTSIDKSLRIWDIRNSFKPVGSIELVYNAKRTCLSDKNCLALSSRKEVYVYKDVFTAPSLYLKHNTSSMVVDMMFCPYEDILTTGHSNGVSNLIVPGSGYPVFDTIEDNPFETKKERQSREVRCLLEKVPYEFIGVKGFEFTEADAEIPEPQKSGENRKRRTALDRFYRT
eukprot:jgi/Antlo1/853/1964